MENFQILANWKEAKNTKDENTVSLWSKIQCFSQKSVSWKHFYMYLIYLPSTLSKSEWFFRRFWWFYYTLSGSSIGLFESQSIFKNKEWTNLFLNERIFLLLIDFHRVLPWNNYWNENYIFIPPYFYECKVWMLNLYK